MANNFRRLKFLLITAILLCDIKNLQVLNAFKQVADNPHGLINSADEVRTEQQALDSANAAVRLTRLGYSVGNAGIVRIFDAQRLQQFAELQLVDAVHDEYFLSGFTLGGRPAESAQAPLQ